MLIERDHHGLMPSSAWPSSPSRPSDRPSDRAAIGERPPDFSLPDSSGKRVDYGWKEIGRFFIALQYGDLCWTQLGELRDAFDKFSADDINVYAISYDDQETLREFAENQNILPASVGY